MKNWEELRLSDLRLLLELADTHSIRELARRRSVQASQISKALVKIEAKMEQKLLHRTTQRVGFNPEGMEILKIARRVLETSEALAPKKKNKPSAQVITVTAPSFLNQLLLPDCLKELHRPQQQKHFRLLEIPGKDLAIAGIKGHFEIALHLQPIDWPRTWVTNSVGSLRSGLFVRADHPLGKAVSETELEEWPFVVPLRWTKNGVQLSNDGCPKAVQERLTGCGAMTASIALELIQRSDQLAFLPELITRVAMKKGLVREVTVKEWKPTLTPLYLSVHAEKVDQKVLETLSQAISSATNM